MVELQTSCGTIKITFMLFPMGGRIGGSEVHTIEGLLRDFKEGCNMVVIVMKIS